MLRKLHLKLFINKKCINTYLKCLIFLFLQTACIIIVPILMTYLSDLTNVDKKTQIFSWLSRNDQIIATSLLLISLSICLLIFGLIANYYSVKFSKELSLNIRNITYSNIQTFTSVEIEKFGQSSLINRLIIDVNNLASAIESFCRMLVQSILIYIGGIIGLIALVIMPDSGASNVTTNHQIPSYAIILIVILITIILIFVIFLISKTSYKSFMNTQKNLDEINFVTQENVLGQKSVKSFVIQDSQNDRFILKNEKLKYWGTKSGMITAWILPSIYFFLDISMVITLWLTNKDLVDKMMSIFLLIGIIIVALINSISAIVQFNRAIPSWLRIVEIATYKSEMKYSETEVKLSNHNSIEIKNLTFNYPNKKEPTLKNISLKIEPNEFIGIIGPTGSGKSTLINLITRLQDPTTGEIKLCNVDIKEFTKHQIRSNIAYCPQEVVLFEGTIKSNILFGNNTATNNEINEAIKNAGLYDFVNSKKEKLDYPVSQRGKNLSGGQKQRLSLARAMVKKTPFLILDDATSSIDMLTEKLICENLVKNKSNQTIILISQRVSALKNTNRIIVIEDGKIIGFDTHKNLIKKCKYYRDIVIAQLGENEVKNAFA